MRDAPLTAHPDSAHFADRLQRAIDAKGAPIAVGIDPVLERLPAPLRPEGSTLAAACAVLSRFGREVIDVVEPFTPVVKINSAFFEAFHERGVEVFYSLIGHAHARGLLVIADVKRGDIGSTAEYYAAGHLARPTFEEFDAARVPDAVTLAGYLGQNALRPFIDLARRGGRGVYVLVRPSDPGADVLHEFGRPTKFYEHLAALVSTWGAEPGLIGECGLSCVGAVVAPKDAESTQKLRESMPHTPWLVPGYGAQGASAGACRPCFRAAGDGALVNASRSVIYAYEQPERIERHGDDWRACIADAARHFAADVTRCLAPA